MSSSKFVRKLSSLIFITSSAGVLAGGYFFLKNDEKFFKNVIMPGVRLIDAEVAHELAVKACKLKLLPWVTYQDPETLVSGKINQSFPGFP